MEKDFHYYTIYKLSKLSGFSDNDAETISYASQYVDDSTESEPIEATPGQHFDTVRTAHYQLEAFDWDVQKKIYIPFHFLPASIRWEDPVNFSYVTTRASGAETELAIKLIEDALTENNKLFRFIRLGVAIHTLSDTFSHFGFSGRRNDENNVRTIWYMTDKGTWDRQEVKWILDFFAPRIGHAEAFACPDEPFLHWKYEDDSERTIERENYRHCMAGAELVYKFLCKAKKNRNLSGNLLSDYPAEHARMETLFRKKGDLDDRCNSWMNYANAPEYDKEKWRKAAVKGDVKWDRMSGSDLRSHLKKIVGKRGFDSSKWAFFHRAAHKQRSLVVEWLN
jgi:hypothetical protein